MSRKIALLGVVFLFLAVLCLSAVAQSAEEELKKLEMDRAAAVVKGDTATLEKQTADDYTFINSNGQMADKSQLLSAIKSGQSKLSMDEISDMKVRVYGNVAVITGKSNVKGTLNGKDATGQVVFTRVWEKKGGRWQTVALQQTKVSE